MKHNASVIGLDIAKNIFYAVGVDAHGHEVLKRKLTRNQVLAFFANLPAAKVGMEACAGAHYWARQINALGHDVKLIAGQHVSRRVVGNKNDYRPHFVLQQIHGICGKRGIRNVYRRRGSAIRAVALMQLAIRARGKRGCRPSAQAGFHQPLRRS